MNDLFSTIMRRLRLLPVLIVVASLGFVVRVGDTVLQVKNLRGTAQAQEEQVAEAKAPAPKVDDTAKAPSDADLTDAKSAAAPPEPKAPTVTTGEKIEPAKEWADSESDLDDSTVRQEVFEDLQQRRQLVEQKEKDIAQREALLKAGTEEINKKIEELTAIKNEIQGLLKKQNTEEEASTARLVKIYEGMKPKDAARIFNQLDMDVLLSVVTKMSERKTSPIIALMDPDKARSLTLFLSEQSKLPGASADPKQGFGDPTQPPALPESAIR